MGVCGSSEMDVWRTLKVTVAKTREPFLPPLSSLSSRSSSVVVCLTERLPIPRDTALVQCPQTFSHTQQSPARLSH